MIGELPALASEAPSSATWGASAADHPMRAITRAVAFDPDGWNDERKAEVVALFDSLAPEWNDRKVAGRDAPLIDALDRGLAAAPQAHRSVAIELGGGTGLSSALVSDRFPTVASIDISWEMVRMVPADDAFPVNGDGSRLPLVDGAVDALILTNMFLFPAEVDRVVSSSGVVIWVNSRGPETPIHLTAIEVDRALPGAWSGVGSAAGWGTWSVHWRG